MTIDERKQTATGVIQNLILEKQRKAKHIRSYRRT